LEEPHLHQLSDFIEKIQNDRSSNVTDVFAIHFSKILELLLHLVWNYCVWAARASFSYLQEVFDALSNLMGARGEF